MVMNKNKMNIQQHIADVILDSVASRTWRNRMLKLWIILSLTIFCVRVCMEMSAAVSDAFIPSFALFLCWHQQAMRIFTSHTHTQAHKDKWFEKKYYLYFIAIKSVSILNGGVAYVEYLLHKYTRPSKPSAYNLSWRNQDFHDCNEDDNDNPKKKKS